MTTEKNDYSRRSVMTGIAAAVAVAAVPTIASPEPDAELIALGREIEPLVIANLDAILGWAPRLCEASRACYAKFGREIGDDPEGPRKHAWHEVHDSVTSANGFEAFQDRMTETDDALKELAERVAQLEAESVAGLRTKTIVAIWENAPSIADNMSFSWGEDCGAIYSHIRVDRLMPDAWSKTLPLRRKALGRSVRLQVS
jgi:hypothetical protein